jgi:hypothetical protein
MTKATERRHTTERRKENRSVLSLLQKQVDAIHERVYNGLGKEIRDEVAKEVGGLRALVVSILVALLVSLAGIVITGQLNSNTRSAENDRNYKAIIDIGSRLENHIIITGIK